MFLPLGTSTRHGQWCYSGPSRYGNVSDNGHSAGEQEGVGRHQMIEFRGLPAETKVVCAVVRAARDFFANEIARNLTSGNFPRSSCEMIRCENKKSFTTRRRRRRLLRTRVVNHAVYFVSATLARTIITNIITLYDVTRFVSTTTRRLLKCERQCSIYSSELPLIVYPTSVCIHERMWSPEEYVLSIIITRSTEIRAEFTETTTDGPE